MFLFGKSKKKKEAERKRQEELAKQAKIEVEKKAKAEQERQQNEALAKKKMEEAKKVETPKPIAKKPASKKPAVNKTEVKKSPTGKYEVYPEVGLYKYRLKASNGEILAVSFGYSTKSSAKKGIQTFKNAVVENKFEISTDKAGFSHYDLFDARGARVILIGEFYKTLKLAESAVESVKKFYETDKIMDLKEIPSSEIREEIAAIPKTPANPNGKFQLIKEGKAYFIKLIRPYAERRRRQHRSKCRCGGGAASGDRMPRRRRHRGIAGGSCDCIEPRDHGVGGPGRGGPSQRESR